MKNIKQHEDKYVHLPKGYFWAIAIIIGIVGFLFLSTSIWNLDFKPAISNVSAQIISNVHNEIDIIKASVLFAFIIIMETVIAVCTNRTKKFLNNLLWGLLWGLLVGLLVGLLAGLLWGLLAGLLDGEDN